MIRPDDKVPEGADDTRMQALMADLDSAIASFDERFSQLPEERARVPADRATPGPTFPVIDPAARRDLPGREAMPAAAATAAPTPPATSLLAELAQAAARKSERVDDETERRQRLAAALDGALRRINDYLLQLTRHLNTLQPETPLDAALTPQHRLSGIRWQDSMVRTESDSSSEKAALRKLTLRVRYACQPLRLDVADTTLQRLERELQMMSLKFHDAGVVVIPGRGHGHRIEIDGVLPLQLSFAADIGQGRLILRCRNLLGLGLGAYAIAPEAIDEAAMDALGRCLLGAARRLPDSFVPIPFNTPDTVA